jgi:hypothetical protein
VKPLQRILKVLAAALDLAVVIVALAMPAFAAITQQRTNPAGHETQGQGEAITVTNVNPSGRAPPGQNKYERKRGMSDLGYRPFFSHARIVAY